MTVADLVADAAARGVVDFGVTDHIHSAYNRPDLVASRAEYDACAPGPRVHFGVEASCVSQWELDEIATGRYDAPTYGLRSGGPAGGPLALGLTAEDVAVLCIEYVVAGTHWPMYVPMEREAVIRDYHRQNLFLATHPLVTIVAHPWWWMGHWQRADGVYPAEPWLDDFGVIPASMHDEFAAAVLAHGKVVEINLEAMLLTPHYPEAFKRQYLDYLAGLKARGVPLSIGSDCHNLRYDIDFPRADAMLASVGIVDGELWRLGA
jgi:histidinol phosphatase-like PHP family hydrolase